MNTNFKPTVLDSSYTFMVSYCIWSVVCWIILDLHPTRLYYIGFQTGYLVITWSPHSHPLVTAKLGKRRWLNGRGNQAICELLNNTHGLIYAFLYLPVTYMYKKLHYVFATMYPQQALHISSICCHRAALHVKQWAAMKNWTEMSPRLLWVQINVSIPYIGLVSLNFAVQVFISTF